MLDRIIHNHIDSMDIIESNMAIDIDSMVDAIDIDSIIDDPDMVLNSFILDIEDMIEKKYADQAIDNGIKFSQQVNKLNRDIKITDTNDGTLNKDVIDDKRPD